MIPTPLTPHLKLPEYFSVYPPAEDSYLLLDTLEEHLTSSSSSSSPLLCLEIGSGSGVVSTFVKTASPVTSCIAVDINPCAALATQQTAAVNKQEVEVVCCDLAGSLCGLHGCVDLLVFNPPYVPSEEIYPGGIEASYAGGALGREVIDKFLPTAAKFLSKEGVFFLLGIQQNKPLQICDFAKEFGLIGQIVANRKAGIEKLWVIKFTKKHEEQHHEKQQLQHEQQQV